MTFARFVPTRLAVLPCLLAMTACDRGTAMVAPLEATQGLRAPEFRGKGDAWLNGPAQRMADLRGKVVLVDFWEYTCVNCIRTFPYLRAWHERYKDKGLVIVGIHTPEFKFAERRDNVEAAVKRFAIRWPVLLDPAYENWGAYENQYWPRKYLIDAKGQIVYDHAGEGAYEETERKIQELLRAANPKVDLPPILGPIRAADRPGADCRDVTPELYAGRRGFESGHLGLSAFATGRVGDYRLPSNLREGVIHLSGRWRTQEEHLEKVEAAPALLEVRYRAKALNSVLRRTGPARWVEVRQDGMAIPEKDRGEDVVVRDGRTYIRLDEPRMYHLVENATWGEHVFEFRPVEPGFEIYSFTFTTECTGG